MTRTEALEAVAVAAKDVQAQRGTCSPALLGMLGGLFQALTDLDAAPRPKLDDLARLIYAWRPATVMNINHPDFGKPVPWEGFWNKDVYRTRARAAAEALGVEVTE